jgi:mono/diheme cytochrome c family protein
MRRGGRDAKKTCCGALAFALVILVVAAVVGALRCGFSSRDEPSLVESYVARTARKLAVPSKARREKNPFPPSPELIAEARAHFADHCAICHANNGSGNTEIGRITGNLSDGKLTIESVTAAKKATPRNHSES